MRAYTLYQSVSAARLTRRLGSMNADTLVTAAMNELGDYDAIVFAVIGLRLTIDRTAARVAKANAAQRKRIVGGVLRGATRTGQRQRVRGLP